MQAFVFVLFTLSKIQISFLIIKKLRNNASNLSDSSYYRLSRKDVNIECLFLLMHLYFTALCKILSHYANHFHIMQNTFTLCKILSHYAKYKNCILKERKNQLLQLLLLYHRLSRKRLRKIYIYKCMHCTIHIMQNNKIAS